MLHLINEELFSYDIKSGDKFTSIRVLNSSKLQGPEYVRDRGAETVRKNTENIIPIEREVLRFSLPKSQTKEDGNLKIEDVDLTLPMSLNLRAKPNGKQSVEVRLHEASGYNKANIFVIAFPFNGMIKPIPKDPRYRIYHGVIVKSTTPIYLDRNRYRKVLYLVCEPNVKLFDPSHKYHVDEIKIELESFGLYKDDTGNEKTNYEKFTLSVYDNNQSKVSWSRETLNEGIRIETDRGSQIWSTYYYQNDRNNERKSFSGNNYNSNRDNRNNNQNQDNNQNQRDNNHVSQSPPIIDTNKHGIPRENFRGGYGRDIVKDFFDDEDDDYGNKKNNQRRKGGNSNKRRK